MFNLIQAEVLKQKRSFNQKIVWIMPCITILLSFFLMGPSYIQSASYNWWYILFLPFTFTYVTSSLIKKEKKHNFHGLLGIISNKKQLWYAKVGVGTGYLFITCLLFCVAILLSGELFYQALSPCSTLLGSLYLFITFAWQIPLVLFLTWKYSMFVTCIGSIICNLIIACLFAIKPYWFLIPFSIPSRLMCPILKIMPNGLPVIEGSVFENQSVIWIGVLISILLFLGFTWLSAVLFEKLEEIK